MIRYFDFTNCRTLKNHEDNMTLRSVYMHGHVSKRDEMIDIVYPL